ncbi:MAG: hypothetical protein B7Y51_10295 [Burkholderiales bacterium 28-67-8]|nr:MAG: hypothetical protein B7Y51_10295 [Burkholderiales bacterium 28-67-8]
MTKKLPSGDTTGIGLLSELLLEMAAAQAFADKREPVPAPCRRTPRTARDCTRIDGFEVASYFGWLFNISSVIMNVSLAVLLLPMLAALLLGCLLGAWTRRSTPHAPALPKEWAVSARAVLTGDERSVYQLLRSAFPRHLIVPKLALVRFCKPNDVAKVRYWYALLGSSYVTFALCESDGRVLLAVDLDADRPRSRRSLQVRQSVLTACGIKHLWINAQKLPGISELRAAMPLGTPAGAAQTSRETGPTPLLDAAWTTLASTVAARRAQRNPKWQESSLFQDSFFSSIGVAESATEMMSRPPRAAAAGATAVSTPDQIEVGSADEPRTMVR